MTDKLTAEERARAIINHEWFDDPDTLITTHLEKFIIEQIKSAEKDADRAGFDRGIKNFDEMRAVRYREGFRAGQEDMRERAARVVSPGDDAEFGAKVHSLMEDLASCIGALPIKTGTEG